MDCTLYKNGYIIKKYGNFQPIYMYFCNEQRQRRDQKKREIREKLQNSRSVAKKKGIGQEKAYEYMINLNREAKRRIKRQ